MKKALKVGTGAKAAELRSVLAALGSAKKAQAAARFFKTGPGGYSEGDRFLGVSVPEQRRVAARFKDLPLKEALALLKNGAHEERLMALMIWGLQFKAAEDEAVRAGIVEAYLANTRHINNWDLVDDSAAPILGAWLKDKDRALLYRLVASPLLWERRIAVVATHHFIRAGESKDALRLARLLLDDQEDLMHKAAGWTLREVGKRVSRDDLSGFLGKHAHKMPRTMLRYAIEHYPETERKRWMGARERPLFPMKDGKIRSGTR
jgi:3-methyladenine DNA glycosylase AlkD